MWYVGVSVVLGYGVPLVPAALGQFGLDPVIESWYVRCIGGYNSHSVAGSQLVCQP